MCLGEHLWACPFFLPPLFFASGSDRKKRQRASLSSDGSIIRENSAWGKEKQKEKVTFTEIDGMMKKIDRQKQQNQEMGRMD